MIQTYQPNHPVLRRIIDEGYPAFAEAALPERQEAGLPPYTAMAVVRAESSDAKRPLAFLREIREQLITRSPGPIELSYPVSALMERRAGRYRALLALRAGERSTLGGLLRQSMDSIDASARRWRVRCAVDVDPHETL